MLAAGDGYGGGQADPRERIQVEFVSANPTGPLTAASGRHAAYGDALRRILRFIGHEVEGEYYFNDAGAQIDRLGESIRARARGEEPPEDGYQGDYVHGAGRADPRRGRARALDELAAKGVELMIERIRATLAALPRRVRQLVPRALAARRRRRARCAAPSRAWRSRAPPTAPTARCGCARSALGDDKDRVLERSSGEPTYFASDVAYTESKLERGFDRLFIVLGSDHHGYIARMRAMMAALGADPDRLEIPILQFVHIVERGERASMSKRRGDFITLDELIDEIGVDATRFFMLQRSHDSTVDLDLDLAREQSAENPVYYVQYAHARIALGPAQGGRGAGRGGARRSRCRRRAALEPAERELIKKLLAFPARSPRRPSAARRTGSPPTRSSWRRRFTAFYRDCHGRRRRARGARVLPDRPQRRHQADDRALAGPARGQRSRDDVAGRSRTRRRRPARGRGRRPWRRCG